MSKAADIKALRRQTILSQLEDAHPAGLPQATINSGLKLAGFEVAETRLLADLSALIEHGLIVRTADPLSPARKTYTITEQGIADL